MSEKIKRQVKRFYSWKMILVLSLIIAIMGAGALMADFYTGDTTDDFTMGNVGIGTDNPQHNLEVDGTVKIHMLEFDRGQDSNLYSLTREYAIYQEAGPWQSPYPDLRINYTSGIKYIANYVYGGHKFYTAQNSDGTPVHLSLSIGDTTDHNVRVYNNLIVFNRIGVGTESPSSTLDIAGTTTSTNYACSSDARWKKNINPYHNALDKILDLKGVTYFWKSEEYKDRNFSKEKQIGFLAQEVEKIIPELVTTDNKGYKSMSYDKLTVVIVEAIKELKAKNDEKLSALEKENSGLKARIATLEKMNERVARLERAMNAKERLIGMK